MVAGTRLPATASDARELAAPGVIVDARMPMPIELERYPLHTRQVVCEGFRRSDGYYEFEGRLLDRKAHDLHLLFKQVPAGQPVHQMQVVLVVDQDWRVREARASSDAAPTPYCREIAVAYSNLQGLTIGRGFKRELLRLLGGERGCTHLTDLVEALATTVFQTLMTLRYDGRQAPGGATDDNPLRHVLGTCHAYRWEGPAARKLSGP